MIRLLPLALLSLSLGALGCLGAPEHCTECGKISSTGSGGGGGGIEIDAASGGAGGDGGSSGAGGAVGGSGGDGGGGAGGTGGTAGAGGGGGSGGGGGAGGGGMDAGVADAPRDQGSVVDTGPEVPPMVLPIVFYTFDQTTGTVATDSSGNGHDGTLVGGATFGTGFVRNDLSLSGTNQYLTVPPNLLNNARELTIAAWVRVRVDRVWARVFDFGIDMTRYMFLTAHAGNAPIAVRFAITTGGNAAEQQLNGTAILPVGAFTHVAVVLNAGGGGTLYIGGAPVATNAALNLRPSDLGATVNNWVGRSQYAVDPLLNGEIDELRIYDKALTAADITTIFNAR